MPHEHYWGVFLLILADQIGVPLPAAPSLVIVGMHWRAGTLQLLPLWAVILAASLIGHLPWYWAGRRQGISLLRRLCRLSVEPDGCVQRVERLFTAWGPVGLIAARFVPGLDIVAQPLVGIIGMRPWVYIAWTVAGGIVWSTSLMGLGWLFGEHLKSIFDPALKAIDGFVVPIVAAAVALVIAITVLRRYRSILGLDVERVDVQGLKSRLDAGEQVIIFDLRHPLQLRRHPQSIPGAQRFARSVLLSSRQDLPRPTVVMFCNCLHEITSARLAKTLRREGFDQVFPLDGGLDAWMRAGYATADMRADAHSAAPA